VRIQYLFLLMFVSITAFSAYKYISRTFGVANCSSTYFFEPDFSIDDLEYQIVAANLALHNKFPVYGFISSMDDYHLCKYPDSVAYYRDTKKAGTLIFVSKPPLYSLCLGVAYKLFGFKPCIALLFNFICFILIVSLMPVAGFFIYRLPGSIAGIIAALLYLSIQEIKLYTINAEGLTALLVMIAFVIGVATIRARKLFMYFILGISLGLLMLCKGYFVLSLILFSIYLLYKLFKDNTFIYLRALIFINLGPCILILLWMIYINPLVHNDLPERLLFYQKLKATAPQLLLSDRSQGFDSTGKVRSDVIECINKHYQYQFAKVNGLVVISNLVNDDNILDVHNEYCTDGDFHPEWRIISNSFYNQHPGLTGYQRLWLFYSEKPRLGLQIALAKLINASKSPANIIFFISIIAIALLLITHRLNELLVPAAILLSDIFFVLILMYGDIRFVQTVNSVATLFFILGLLILCKAIASYISKLGRYSL